MENKFVVVDLETTGNLPKKGDKIIQFAAVVIENGVITEKFSSFLNPQKTIPTFIEELTGIRDEMVKDAPLFAEIAPKVNSLLKDAYFVAHNVLFDLSFLQEELIQAGFPGFYGPVLDTVEMARILYPTADGYKLSDLAERENLLHDRPHQADSDALVTAELFLILIKRFCQLPLVTLRRLMPLSGGLKSDLQQFLEEMLEEISFNEEEHSDAFEIFKGIALKKIPEKQKLLSNQTDLQYPNGESEKIRMLKDSFPSFETREGQFQMMDAVFNSLQNDNHTLIEAGTGVGKTMGYLLPAAYFAKLTNQPIIVSTHTIQLQEQILKKEIPLLNKILPFEITAVLRKGRSHYIDLKKFKKTLLDEESDNYDSTLTKMQILVWLTETETGDKDELNLSSGGSLFWNKIKNDPSLFPSDPEWIERDFYHKAKLAAEKAEIIITNHSLLLSDLKENGTVLPKYDYVIIDEAHHLEKTAIGFFGYSLDYLSTRLLLGQFGQYEQKQLFYELEEIIKTKVPSSEEPTLHTFELNQMVIDLTFEMDEFFKLIAIFAKSQQSNTKGFYKAKVRFSETDFSKEKRALIHSAERLIFLLKDVHSSIENRLGLIQKEHKILTLDQETKIEEIALFLKEIDNLRQIVKHCFITDTHFVKWIEMDVRSPQNVTTFMAQPASVAPALKQQLFEQKKAGILTSATLTVNDSFDYIKKEMGLGSNSVHTLTIPSPFHYHEQVQLLIPEDLPEVKTVSLDEYVIAITEHIITIAEATKGRMLILFTAYDMLKKTHELIKESGFLDDYVLIAQGISGGSRSRLTRNFQRYDKAILMGTSSFWEGVDIPGEDLSCLIIVRLPFSPPDEPFTEAKCQIIEKSGGNAFKEYSLPDAILKFKQGFGRLIRTENDRGIVIVFDKRIVNTQYGKSFLKSIPPVTIKKAPMNKLVKIILSWL
ncbi:ATP-dependent DNA helicase DinG [Bacillus sp. JJ1764]|uniref:ATP-dependent DNA helicase DinG n=1 Tax=Bacillus sp. JJ1764 TaxID=3122964 RepID=UPI002FFEC836